MSLVGNLEVFPLEDVLLMLKRSAKTGCLTVDGPSTHGRIFVEGGDLTLVTTGADEDFKRQLVQASLVDDETLHAVESGAAPLLAKPSAGDSQGELETFLREHLIESLYRIHRQGAGQFEFSVETTPRLATGLHLDASELFSLAEGRAQEWGEIESVISDLNLRYRMIKRLPSNEPVTIAPSSWSILSALESGSSVHGVAATLGINSFTAASEVATLAREGLVEEVETNPAPLTSDEGANWEQAVELTDDVVPYVATDSSEGLQAGQQQSEVEESGQPNFEQPESVQEFGQPPHEQPQYEQPQYEQAHSDWVDPGVVTGNETPNGAGPGGTDLPTRRSSLSQALSSVVSQLQATDDPSTDNGDVIIPQYTPEDQTPDDQKQAQDESAAVTDAPDPIGEAPAEVGPVSSWWDSASADFNDDSDTRFVPDADSTQPIEPVATAFPDTSVPDNSEQEPLVDPPVERWWAPTNDYRGDVDRADTSSTDNPSYEDTSSENISSPDEDDDEQELDSGEETGFGRGILRRRLLGNLPRGDGSD